MVDALKAKPPNEMQVGDRSMSQVSGLVHIRQAHAPTTIADSR